MLHFSLCKNVFAIYGKAKESSLELINKTLVIHVSYPRIFTPSAYLAASALSQLTLSLLDRCSQANEPYGGIYLMLLSSTDI